MKKNIPAGQTLTSKPKYSNLEIANQMFKDAWLVKHTFFQKKFPHLSPIEIKKKTCEYFSQIKD